MVTFCLVQQYPCYSACLRATEKAVSGIATMTAWKSDPANLSLNLTLPFQPNPVCDCYHRLPTEPGVAVGFNTDIAE